jgi:hypothetical protein
MSDRIRELLRRNLEEVFGEADAGRRLVWAFGPRGEAPDYTGLDGIIVRRALSIPRFNAVVRGALIVLGLFIRP